MSAKESQAGFVVKKDLSKKEMAICAVAGVALFSTSFLPYVAESLDKGMRILPNTDGRAYLMSESEFEESNQEFITFVHRAGNSENGIRNAASSNAAFAELDLNKDDESLFAYHGKNFDVNLPGVGKILEIGVDSEKLEIRSGDPNFGIENAFQIASEVKVGLFIDLKRGDINKNDIKYLKTLSNNLNVPLMLHSGRPDIVDMAILTLVELEKYEVEKTLVMDVPANDEAWEAFFAKGGRAALTDIKSARKYKDRLKNVFVIVGDAKNKSDLESLLSIGVVNGLMFDSKEGK